MRWFLYFFLVGFFWVSCSEEKNPVAPVVKEPAFGIYFLQDSSIKIYDVMDTDINSLKLASEPWISNEQIEYYDYSSNCMYLKKEKTELFPVFNFTLVNFPASWAKKPFVVKCGKQRCYMGYFDIEHSTSPYDPLRFPQMMFWHNKSYYPRDVIFSEWMFLYLDDPQENEIVKNTLLREGLYRGGITASFDTTNAIRIIENADTTTIEYTFTLTNEDQDNLYVMDPALMDVEFFNYFNNGPTFRSLTSPRIYYSDYAKSRKLYESWSSEYLKYLTKLAPGQSIQRSVKLKGYAHFIPDDYVFSWFYNNPIQGLEKDERELADGRIWLGPVRSNLLILTLEDFPGSQLKISQVQKGREFIEKQMFGNIYYHR